MVFHYSYCIYDILNQGLYCLWIISRELFKANVTDSWLLGTLTNWFWAVFVFNINIDLRNSCNEVRVNETVKRVDSEYKRAPLRESDTLHIMFVNRFCHTILNREREKERDGERETRERERERGEICRYREN